MVKAKLKQLDEKKEAIEKEINALQEELTVVAQNRDKTFGSIQELKKQREHGVCFFSSLIMAIQLKVFTKSIHFTCRIPLFIKTACSWSKPKN